MYHPTGPVGPTMSNTTPNGHRNSTDEVGLTPYFHFGPVYITFVLKILMGKNIFSPLHMDPVTNRAQPLHMDVPHFCAWTFSRP